MEGGKNLITGVDIEKEYEDALERITKLQHRWWQHVINCVPMIIGFAVIIWSWSVLSHSFHDLSYSLSQLAPNSVVPNENIGQIGLLLSTSSVNMAVWFARVGIGFAAFAIGWAWYTYRANKRTSEILLNLILLNSKLVITHIDGVAETILSAQSSHPPIATSTPQVKRQRRKSKGNS